MIFPPHEENSVPIFVHIYTPQFESVQYMLMKVHHISPDQYCSVNLVTVTKVAHSENMSFKPGTSILKQCVSSEL